MRTVKTIKSEAEKALEEYNKHYNTCEICQQAVTCAEDETECYGATFLYEDYQRLLDEVDYAEQVFNAELKDRGKLANCS